MQNVQNMMGSLHQERIGITIDEAIHGKVKIIQWKNPEEDTILRRMGGVHIILNLSCIGHLYAESGIEDVF